MPGASVFQPQWAKIRKKCNFPFTSKDKINGFLERGAASAKRGHQSEEIFL